MFIDYQKQYEELKEYILKKNLEIFKELGHPDTGFVDHSLAQLINEIVVKMIDIEWKSYSKPNIWINNPLRTAEDAKRECMKLVRLKANQNIED